MTLPELQALLDAGQFHHATIRTGIARGLHIYSKADGHLPAYEYVGYFRSAAADYKAAHDLVRHTGVSLNAYGRG